MAGAAGQVPRARLKEKGAVVMARKKGKDWLWWVRCEGYPDVPVIAPDWERATVEAARLWCVPWAKVVARCELREKLPAMRCVCRRCSRIFHGKGTLCDDCLHALKVEAQRTAEYKKQYYRRQYAGERKAMIKAES